MVLACEDVLSSPVSTFLIGAEKKEYDLIDAVVNRCNSHGKNALTDDSEHGDKVRCTWIRDVDEDTFSRFEEYAYTGDYTAASVKLRDSSTSSNKIDPHGSMFSQKKEQARKLSLTRVKAWSAFIDNYPSLEVAPNETHQNSNYREDFTERFLSHARLSVFADTYKFSNLSELCIEKLYELLLAFTLFRSSIGDVVELVKYTYENAREDKDGYEGLRTIVSHYAACLIDHLVEDAGVGRLLAENSELRDDIHRHL